MFFTAKSLSAILIFSTFSLSVISFPTSASSENVEVNSVAVVVDSSDSMGRIVPGTSETVLQMVVRVLSSMNNFGLVTGNWVTNYAFGSVRRGNQRTCEDDPNYISLRMPAQTWFKNKTLNTSCMISGWVGPDSENGALSGGLIDNNVRRLYGESWVGRIIFSDVSMLSKGLRKFVNDYEDFSKLPIYGDPPPYAAPGPGDPYIPPPEAPPIPDPNAPLIIFITDGGESCNRQSSLAQTNNPEMMLRDFGLSSTELTALIFVIVVNPISINDFNRWDRVITALKTQAGSTGINRHSASFLAANETGLRNSFLWIRQALSTQSFVRVFRSYEPCASCFPTQMDVCNCCVMANQCRVACNNPLGPSPGCVECIGEGADPAEWVIDDPSVYCRTLARDPNNGTIPCSDQPVLPAAMDHYSVPDTYATFPTRYVTGPWNAPWGKGTPTIGPPARFW